ncbi:DNA-binding helix-turn-helix domain protein [Leptospira santarosai str. ZUN179]|uniref:DNA-binding helix-turn-helix domain protein n=1 Tax=Leptospira santarosai str. ZUN179 TaxID=1049985 RepID=M6URY1_9LEPT|nr:DNA-binding helix-turn-helix domain protein [Leptospira santarosai str. ZUN179]
MTLREAAKKMGISPRTLQKLVHDFKLIRYVEEFNSHNQRTFNLYQEDVEKLIELKNKGKISSWRGFLTVFTGRSPIKLYSVKYLREVDPLLLRKITN